MRPSSIAMMNKMFVIALMLLAMGGLAQLQDANEVRIAINSTRISTGALFCPCSPTQRGTKERALEIFNEWIEISKTFSDGIMRDRAILDGYDSCAAELSDEDCVNAAFKIRNRIVICTHLKQSGRSLFDVVDSKIELRTVAKCSADVSAARLPKPDDTPPGVPTVEASKPDDAIAAPIEDNPTVETSDDESPVAEPTASAPEQETEPPASGAKSSGASAEAGTTSIPRRVNEGCVAIEHLQGAITQHAQPLLRPVLCGRGICATPNHAFIVNSEWTSMRELCNARWTCVQDARLVNNLKIRANRRWQIAPGIIATPYDRRFPRWCSWAVQIGEDAFPLLFALVLAAVAFAATRMATKA